MSDTSEPRTPEPSDLTDATGDAGAVVSRRTMMRGAAVGGLALPLLAACGGGDDGATDSGADKPGEAGPSRAGSGPVPTSAVPVGGGLILSDQKAVVTQPTKGEFKAFTVTCTHKQCPVAEVSDGAIICPCHGSRFSITDGSAVKGPATEPLAAKKVSVRGARITVT